MKQNPFREYLERKGDSRSHADWSFDYAHRTSESPTGKPKFGSLDRAHVLAHNWEELNGKGRPYVTFAYNLSDPLETLIDYQLKDYKRSILSNIAEPVERNRLRGLQNENVEEEDPVYQKLSSLRTYILGMASNSLDYRFGEKIGEALEKIHGPYYRMVTRTMKQDEYERLNNLNLEELASEMLEEAKTE